MNEPGRGIAILLGMAVLLAILVILAVRALRWARKGSPAAAFIGWALLLFGAGINPQPPPQEQIEEANREKKIEKDSESGAPKD